LVESNAALKISAKGAGPAVERHAREGSCAPYSTTPSTRPRRDISM
jgi:hypothetical protein